MPRPRAIVPRLEKRPELQDGKLREGSIDCVGLVGTASRVTTHTARPDRATAIKAVARIGYQDKRSTSITSTSSWITALPFRAATDSEILISQFTGRYSCRGANSPWSNRATRSRLSHGGPSSTAGLAAKSRASCRAVRYPSC